MTVRLKKREHQNVWIVRKQSLNDNCGSYGGHNVSPYHCETLHRKIHRLAVQLCEGRKGNC